MPGTTTQLSPRQQEVMDCLKRGLTVREIADELSVTPNAIYLQLQKMRSRGALPHSFTATGRPPREIRQPGQDVLAQLLSDTENGGLPDAGAAGNLALLQLLKETRDSLDAMSARITAVLPR